MKNRIKDWHEVLLQHGCKYDVLLDHLKSYFYKQAYIKIFIVRCLLFFPTFGIH